MTCLVGFGRFLAEPFNGSSAMGEEETFNIVIRGRFD